MLLELTLEELEAIEAALIKQSNIARFNAGKQNLVSPDIAIKWQKQFSICGNLLNRIASAKAERIAAN
jgi:hypothetical protein